MNSHEGTCCDDASCCGYPSDVSPDRPRVLQSAPDLRCRRHNVQMAQATGETSTCFAAADLKVHLPQNPDVDPWPACRAHVEEILTAAVLLFGHAELVQVTPVMVKRFRFEQITLAALKASVEGDQS